MKISFNQNFNSSLENIFPSEKLSQKPKESFHQIFNQSFDKDFNNDFRKDYFKKDLKENSQEKDKISSKADNYLDKYQEKSSLKEIQENKKDNSQPDNSLKEKKTKEKDITKVKEIEEDNQEKKNNHKKNLENLLELFAKLQELLAKTPNQKKSKISQKQLNEVVKNTLQKINSLLQKKFKNFGDFSLPKNSKNQLQEILSWLEKNLNQNLLADFTQKAEKDFLQKNNFLQSEFNFSIKEVKQGIQQILSKLESSNDSSLLQQVKTLSTENAEKAKIFSNEINDFNNKELLNKELQSNNLKNKNLKINDAKKNHLQNLNSIHQKNNSQKKFSKVEEKKNSNGEISSFEKFKLDFKNLSSNEILKNKEVTKKVAHQLSNSIQQAIVNNKKITHLQLKPQELGKVEILLHQEKDRVQVKFIVGSESVKEIIEQKVLQIRESLAEKHIKFHSFETEIKQDNQQHKRQNQEYQQEHRITATKKDKKKNVTAVQSFNSYQNLSSMPYLENKNLSVNLVA